MKTNLSSAIEQLCSEAILYEDFKNITNSLEILIASKNASLPEEGLEQLREIWKSLKESDIFDKPLTRAARKIDAISLSISRVLTKFREFFSDKEYHELNKISSSGFAVAQVMKGIHYINKSLIHDQTTINLANFTKGINLLSKGLKENPKLIHLDDYENFKELGEVAIEISKKINEESVQLDEEESTEEHKKYKEVIHLSGISILWSVGQFENKIKKQRSFGTIEDFVEYIDNGDEEEKRRRKKKQIDLIDLWIDSPSNEEEDTEECFKNIDERRKRKLFTNIINNS
ncbi:hypothetical protein [Floridanema evergladense]|uniref:Uncharacterized protein n=1 Tax=Floridaenema evergladense BLCC-F167 TaxID=3153639 RepID=A0ABV4WKK2_9CYAN